MAFNFEITEDDVLAEYEDGIEKAQRYHRVMELRRSGVSPAAIAKATGVSRTSVGDYLRGGKTSGLNGVDYLLERGLLPMGLSNPRFALYNLFNGLAWWGGTIDANHAGNFRPHRRARQKGNFEEEMMKAIAGELNVLGKDNASEGRIPFSTRVSRMLRNFRKPGAKKNSGVLVPRHVDEGFDYYSEPTNDADDIAAVLPLLRDNIHLLISIRGRPSRRQSAIIGLHGYPTKKLARAQGKRVQSIMQVVFPGMKVNLQGPYPIEHKGQIISQHSRLFLPGSRERVESIIKTCPDRVAKVIEATREAIKVESR